MTYTPIPTGIVDANNSSSTPLTANSTFTGTATDVTIYSSATLYAYSDVASATNGFTYQTSTDGVTWTSTKTYSVNAGLTQRHTVAIVAKYFRVTYTNGSSNQSIFQLQTIFHVQKNKGLVGSIAQQLNTETQDVDLVRAVICGITEGGNYSQNTSIDGEGHIEVAIQNPRTAFGEIRMSQPFPTVQADFVYGINNNIFFPPSVAGSGATAYQSQAMLNLVTGATANSSSVVYTRKALKYRDGQGAIGRFSGLFTQGVSGSYQIIGMGNTYNGYFFGYTGVTFGVMRRTNITGTPVDNWIPQSSWNGDLMNGQGGVNNKSGMLLDPTKGNVYQVSMGYLGFSNIYFSILNSYNGQFVIVHELQYTNMNTTPQVSNPSLNGYFGAFNTTNTTAITTKSGSIGLMVDGIRRYLGPIYAFDNGKTGVSALTNIFTLRNNTTFNGYPNQSQAYIRSVSLAGNGGNGIATLQIILNATLSGAVYTNIDASNSIISYDTTATFSGGTVLFNTNINSSSGNQYADLSDILVYFAPGETLTFAVKATATTVASVATNWVEDA